MRKPLIAGNWKMHKTTQESEVFASGLLELIQHVENVDVIVAPTALALDRVAQVLSGSSVGIAAQNVHSHNQGAFTGEIAPSMLKAIGCTHAIVGHSERRQIFGEQDSFIREKVDALLAEGIQPIICIGETLEEREQGQTKARVEAQLRAACENLPLEHVSSITVAYEPVWAIGTGLTATPEQAQEIHAFLRGVLAQLFDETLAQQTRILYGGSVKPANVKALMSETDIDGALVGGASLKLESFTQLVKFPELP